MAPEQILLIPKPHLSPQSQSLTFLSIASLPGVHSRASSVLFYSILSSELALPKMITDIRPVQLIFGTHPHKKEELGQRESS